MHNALAEVIASLTDNDVDDVMARYWRDVEDSAVWKRTPAQTATTGPEDGEAASIRAYQRIHTRKFRLNDRLLHVVATIRPSVDIEHGSDCPLVRCYHAMIVAERLRYCGHTFHAQAVARKVLRDAIKFNEPVLVLQACRIIESMHGAIRDSKKRHSIALIHDQWRRRYLEHEQYRLAISDLLFRCRHRDDEKTLKHLVEIERENAVLLETKSNGFGQLLNDALQVRRFQVKGDHRAAVSYIQQRQGEFSGVLPDSERWIVEWFRNATIRSMLSMGELQAVTARTEHISQSARMIPQITAERHRLRMTAFMRRGSWVNAAREAASLQQVLACFEDPYEEQRFLLLCGYWTMCRQLGIHGHDDIRYMPRLSTFMNSVALISEDRRGLIVYVKIYEVLCLLLQRKDDSVERKVFNLNVYASRNLRFESARPLRAFITFLRSVTYSDISDKAIRRRISSHLRRMETDTGAIPEHMLSPVPLKHLAEAILRHMLEAHG